MRGFRRQRSDRPRNTHRAIGPRPEQLESRQLMTGGVNAYLHPGFLQPNSRPTPNPMIGFQHPYGDTARQLSFLDNDSKILTGKDRQGDEWQITVHGPGVVIVKDVTPNDGYLADDIDTIQIVGADPHNTFVTGQVSASARTLTDGTVYFNRLISLNGVSHIQLNGFTLAQTVYPQTEEPANVGPEIYLPEGVKYLSFHDIDVEFDQAFQDEPFEIQIGRDDTPLVVRPTIQIDSIFNTVINTDFDVLPNGVPQTSPTVKIMVNGQLHGLEMVSATAAPITAGYQYALPQTSITGRTAIQALGIGEVVVPGSLRNTTISKKLPALGDSFTGMDYLGHLSVGGVTDGLAVDVGNGKIGSVILKRGLGDPTGSLPGDKYLGQNYGQWGYPAFGDFGGVIIAKKIGSFQSGPAFNDFRTTMDPDYVQEDTTNWTKYFHRPGRSLTNGVVMAEGSIDHVSIVGDLQSSEIKAGSNYAQYVAGLEPVRGPGSIRALRLKGDLVDSVVSAAYSPGPDNNYGRILNDYTTPVRDRPGAGSITGQLVHGAIYDSAQPTILSYQGAGFFAAVKRGYLPPPQAPKRVQSVNLNF